MDAKAILDHQFMAAAYVATWVIQLSYVAWLAMKWRAAKKAEKSMAAGADGR